MVVLERQVKEIPVVVVQIEIVIVLVLVEVEVVQVNLEHQHPVKGLHLLAVMVYKVLIEMVLLFFMQVEEEVEVV